MTTDRVMLLIDADNVSMDVIEQAVALLLQTHGALHVRRAYCTAESAVKHQAAFKRLGIKPMVNLATGKNSTDIALAVDALDLVLAERPDVVAIASSDSDFAPLVARLREKGCRVVGLGQQGKTGDETQAVYDEFTVIQHRKPALETRQPETRKPAARKTAGAVAKADAAKPAAAKTAAAKAATTRTAKTAAGTAKAQAAVAGPAGVVAAEATPARATPASATPAAKKSAPRAAKPKAAAAQPGAAQAAALATNTSAADPKVLAILACLPELGRGSTLELRVASVRLREAGLLSRSGSTPKLLAPFAAVFELLPPGQPNHVRLRAAQR
jgi:uncharacterized protein (TIGR00288 family)